MRILIVGCYAADAIVSMSHFERLLVAGLSDSGHEVRVIRPRFVIGALKPGSTGLGKWLGYIDKYLLFPRELRAASGWSDVVHLIDQSLAVYTRVLRGVPHVVTCNDLLAVRSALGEFKENRTGWTGRQLQRMIMHGLAGARRVACISENTRNDLLRLSAIDAGKVRLVPMALHHPYAPMPAAQADERLRRMGITLGEKFILAVGGNQWYQNRAGVLRIFQHLREEPEYREVRLVLAGQPLSPELRDYARAAQLAGRLSVLTGLENEDLRALYSGAIALILPALQHGFGWPIIEAQACGCAVFTSNRPPMTEVGGAGAVYIDPEDPAGAAKEILRHLPVSAEKIAAGLANAKRFSVGSMISAYEHLYVESRLKP